MNVRAPSGQVFSLLRTRGSFSPPRLWEPRPWAAAPLWELPEQPPMAPERPPCASRTVLKS